MALRCSPHLWMVHRASESDLSEFTMPVLAVCPVDADVHARCVMSECSGPRGWRSAGHLCPGEADDPTCLESLSPIYRALKRPGSAEGS